MQSTTMIRCLAFVIATLLCPIAQAAPWDWVTFQGNALVPVRSVDGNVQCFSTDNRNCKWGMAAAQLTASQQSNAKPLACGADHKQKYGSDGYSKSGHWCGAAFGRYYARWHRDDVDKVFYSVNPVGDVQCLSTDGRNCLWGQTQLDDATRANIRPLACGVMHKTIWGIDGYSRAGHWCRRIRDSQLSTYTWALDTNRNTAGFALLADFNVDALQDYPTPATTPLRTDLDETWAVPSNNVGDGNAKSFTAIYRTRPSWKQLPVVPVANAVPFQNWVFIRKFVFFGGESGSGAHVLAPDPQWVDLAHRNGVKIYGTIFLAPQDFGGTDRMAEVLYASPISPSRVRSDYPQLEKLFNIAKKLKLDGWFINLESVRAGNDILMKKIGRVTSEILPQYGPLGVEFITYYPDARAANYNGLYPDVTDTSILNVALMVNPNTNGVRVKSVWNGNGIASEYNAAKTYLMFLDEPFWQNMPGLLAPVFRFSEAKATACEFFKGATEGTDTWLGFQYHAKMRYPNGADKSKLLCAGDGISLAEPNPETILTITLPNGIDLGVKKPGDTDYQICEYVTGKQTLCRSSYPTSGDAALKFTSTWFYPAVDSSGAAVQQGAVFYIDPNSLWALSTDHWNDMPAMNTAGQGCVRESNLTVGLTMTVQKSYPVTGTGPVHNDYTGTCKFVFLNVRDPATNRWIARNLRMDVRPYK